MADGTFRSVYRISQPAGCRNVLVLELRELPARRAPDHRDSRFTHRRRDSGWQIAPALAANTEDCGSTPILQDNLNRQGGPQDV